MPMLDTLKIGQPKAGNAKVEIETSIHDVSYFTPRQGQNAPECAIIDLRPHPNSRALFRILDCRKDSVFIAKAAATIRAAETRAERNKFLTVKEEDIAEAKRQAEEGWPAYFGRNAKVVLATEKIGDRQFPVLILEDPDEGANESLLASTAIECGTGKGGFFTREHYGAWRRRIMHRDDETGIRHFMIVTVTSDETPLMLVHRIIKEKSFVEVEYTLKTDVNILERRGRLTKVTVLKGSLANAEYDEEVDEAQEDTSMVKIECPHCEKPLTIKRQNILDAVLMTCTECKKSFPAIGFQTPLYLPEVAEPTNLTKVELDRLEECGITNIEELGVANPRKVAKAKVITRARCQELINETQKLVKAFVIE